MSVPSRFQSEASNLPALRGRRDDKLHGEAEWQVGRRERRPGVASAFTENNDAGEAPTLPAAPGEGAKSRRNQEIP